MPNRSMTLVAVAALATPAAAYAQQAPANVPSRAQVPRPATDVSPPPTTSSYYQMPSQMNADTGPIKSDIAEMKSRLYTIESRENQRNDATINTLQLLNGSTKAQRGALARIEAALAGIEARLTKLVARR